MVRRLGIPSKKDKMQRTLITSVALVIVVAACGSGAEGGAETTVPSDATTTPATLAATTSTTPATTTTETAATEATTTSTVEVTATTLPPSGQAGPGCVDGWVTPTPGTALRTDPLDVIREQMGITGEFLVIEMRYFTGPPPPGTVSIDVYERWYIKAQLVDDPTFRGRFLVHRFPPGAATFAGAPFNTAGWESPDWRSFEGVDSGPEGPPHAVEGLPGLWSGHEIDAVTGDGYYESHALPDEVVSCLDGT